MKLWKWIRMALTAAPLLAGCNGFWDAPVPPTPPPSATSGVFYVLNLGTSQIAGFSVKDGTLTTLPGSPYALPSPPIAIAIAPNNAFLYVSTASGIFLYTIGSSGQLTLGNSSQLLSTDQAASMQVDATNSWLVEAFSGSPNLYAIHINSSTGMLVSPIVESVPLPFSVVKQVAISPDNNLAFVAMGTDGTAIVPFNANNTNPLGRATILAVKNAGGGALSVAVDPIVTGNAASRLLYVGETVAVPGLNTGGLRVFNYSNFQEISGSPFASNGLAPTSILPFSTGAYVYVLNRQVSGSSIGVVTGFSIAESNGVFKLSPLDVTFTAGTFPQGLAEDNTDTFVLAVNFGGNPDLTGYTISATKPGYLETAFTGVAGNGPVQATAIAAMH